MRKGNVVERDTGNLDPAGDGLTEAQRTVLRLVRQGYESKEIGRQLGISHYAVNRRIERAVQVLGARNRKDAARRFTAEEPTYERVACDPLHLSSPTDDAMIRPSDSARRRGFSWPFAISGRVDDLDIRSRLFWALLGIPVVVMLAWGIFLSGVAALDSIGL